MKRSLSKFFRVTSALKYRAGFSRRLEYPKLFSIGSLWIAFSICTGCEGNFSPNTANPSTNDEQSETKNSTPSGCTDSLRCCSDEQKVCYGNIDGSSICFCPELWECSKNPEKCKQAKQVPGAGNWLCTWDEHQYKCSKTGEVNRPPEGSNQWNCSFSEETSMWVCTKSFPPNPTNTPTGTSQWQCTVDNAKDVINCEQKDTSVQTPEKEDNCVDGLDNDGDKLFDCEDSDCPPCQATTIPCEEGKECCDGKDNDGDGKIDEGNVCSGVGEPCPPGAFQICDCYCGVHRKCQNDGTWGPCLVDNSCKVAKVTSHSQCAPNFICDYGKCVLNLFLIFSQCKSHDDCPLGKVCDLGWCTTDQYNPQTCR